jgi:putative addiction module component (TIGR02574 family)
MKHAFHPEALEEYVGSKGTAWDTSTMALPTIDVDHLSTEERLDLIGQLWDSLGAEASTLPLSPAQREELDQRIDDLEREGPTGAPWNDAVHRIGSSR